MGTHVDTKFVFVIVCSKNSQTIQTCSIFMGEKFYFRILCKESKKVYAEAFPFVFLGVLNKFSARFQLFKWLAIIKSCVNIPIYTRFPIFVILSVSVTDMKVPEILNNAL